MELEMVVPFSAIVSEPNTSSVGDSDISTVSISEFLVRVNMPFNAFVPLGPSTVIVPDP